MSDIFQDKKIILKALSLGVFTSLAIIVVLMCAAALILQLSSVIPYSMMDYITLGICAVGTLIGSYIAAAITKSGGLVIGLLCGISVWLCCLIAGFASTDGSISYLTAVKAGIMLICGAVGGIRGVNKKEKIKIK